MLGLIVSIPRGGAADGGGTGGAHYRTLRRRKRVQLARLAADRRDLRRD